MPRRTVLLLPLIGLTLMLAACERPFVPPRVPEIRITLPENPDQLRLDPDVDFAVEATSFRDVERVEILGKPLAYDSTSNLWKGTISLLPGLNQVEITAYDTQDFVGTEVLNMAYIKPRFVDDAPALPFPWRLGGHTATRLQDGSILVTGGAPSLFQTSVNNAFILPPGAAAFEPVQNQMVRPRYGHTATLLPDGRVLILGGSSASAATNVSQLISEAEIYDPVTGRFTEVAFEDENAPLLRMEHVTFLSQGPTSLIIDVYGGLGEDLTSFSDRLAILGDIQSFRFSDNTLSAFSSFVSEQIQPSYAMASTPLSSEETLSNGRFVVSGATFLESGPSNINFSVDFNASPIQVNILNRLAVPRLQHAAAPLVPGITAIFGGFQGSIQTATNSTEVFVELNDRFTSIDSRVSTRRRFAHTATKLPSGRILILGGYSDTGDAISASEYFIWSE